MNHRAYRNTSKMSNHDDYYKRFNKIIIRYNNSAHVYLSIDVRHGNFEVFDSNGFLIDEYTYDNVKQNKHDPTGKHNIKLHK